MIAFQELQEQLLAKDEEIAELKQKAAWKKIVQMSVVFNACKLILSYAFASSIPLQVRHLEKAETCLHGFCFMHDFVFVLKVSFMKNIEFSCFLFLRMPIKSSGR